MSLEVLKQALWTKESLTFLSISMMYFCLSLSSTIRSAILLLLFLSSLLLSLSSSASILISLYPMDLSSAEIKPSTME